MGDPAPLRDVLCGVAMIQVCQQTGLSWRRSGPPWPRRLPTAGFPAPTAGTAGSPTSGERSPAASANWTICSARSAGKQRPHPAIVRRTQRCPTRGATQNHPICATTAGRKLRRRAEQIGGFARWRRPALVTGCDTDSMPGAARFAGSAHARARMIIRNRTRAGTPEACHLGSPARVQCHAGKPLNSRDGRIRTGGLLLPKQAR